MTHHIKGAPNWGTQESESTYAATSIALTMKRDNVLVGNARQIRNVAGRCEGRRVDRRFGPPWAARQIAKSFVPPAPQRESKSWTQGATVGIIPYEDKMLNHCKTDFSLSCFQLTWI